MISAKQDAKSDFGVFVSVILLGELWVLFPGSVGQG